MRVVTNNARAIRYNYNKALREKPELRGEASYWFKIMPSGRVLRCTLRESTLGDEEFEDMIVGKMLQWIFPAVDESDGSTVCVLEYKMVF